jgi:tetratricopeptide (TPR) repeat protein
MALSSEAVQAAAEAMRQISTEAAGERGRRAAVAALVLRAVEAELEWREDAKFVGRRAEVEVAAVANGSERRYLKGLLTAARGGMVEDVAGVLVEYASGLEAARRLEEAAAVLALAGSVMPECAEVALRAGRVARLQGDAARALSLYRSAREMDGGSGPMGRLAEIGEAVVAAEPAQALGEVIRRAASLGDMEAAAVGLEERARVRRQGEDRRGAARDLRAAALRFRDPVDRGRVAHELADLYVAAGDAEAAREALLFGLAVGDRSQQEHARSRLHTLSRDLGDQLGMRRWRSFRPPALVSLSARPTKVRAGTESAAGRLSRWRRRAEAALAAGY